MATDADHAALLVDPHGTANQEQQPFDRFSLFGQNRPGFVFDMFGQFQQALGMGLFDLRHHRLDKLLLVFGKLGPSVFDLQDQQLDQIDADENDFPEDGDEVEQEEIAVKGGNHAGRDGDDAQPKHRAHHHRCDEKNVRQMPHQLARCGKLFNQERVPIHSPSLAVGHHASAIRIAVSSTTKSKC